MIDHDMPKAYWTKMKINDKRKMTENKEMQSRNLMKNTEKSNAKS